MMATLVIGGVKSLKTDIAVKTEMYNKCRVCLQEGNIPIYNNQSVSRLCENVCIFGDIEMQEEDPYPKHLCGTCFNSLQGAIRFRQTARETDRILKRPVFQKVLSPNQEYLCDTSVSIKSENEDAIGQSGDHEKMVKENVVSIFIKSEEIIRPNTEHEQNSNYILIHPLQDKFINKEDETISLNTTVHSPTSLNTHINNKNISIGNEYNAIPTLKNRLVFECDLESIKNRKLTSISKLTTTQTNQPSSDVVNIGYIPPAYYKYFKPTSNDNVFVCEMCDQTVQKYSRKQHYTLHDPNTVAPRYKCGVCDKVFLQKNRYNKHVNYAHSVDNPITYKCTKCSYQSTSRAQMNLHMRSHSEKRHACDLCPRKFKYRCYLLKHKLTHGDNTNYLTNTLIECEEYFKVVDSVDGVKMVECLICNRTMKKVSRRRHYELLHMQNKSSKYLCDVCGKGFLLQSNYLVHKTIHVNDFPFQCKICPYKGRNTGLLRTHMQIHSRQNQFKCTICSKQCTFKSNLIRHMRRHTEPEYKCDVCNKRFYEKYVLNHHLEIQHLRRNKPIQCGQCDKSYLTRKNLLKHQIKAHDRKKSEQPGKLAHYKAAELQNKK